MKKVYKRNQAHWIVKEYKDYMEIFLLSGIFYMVSYGIYRLLAGGLFFLNMFVILWMIIYEVKNVIKIEVMKE